MNIFIKKIFIFLLILWYMPVFVFAAELFFESNNQSLAPSEEFLVSVFLNTVEESVNAIEGKILFPIDLLEMKEIRDGNSIVNFWIQKPIEKQGEITFSGITPSGFSGQREFLFSVVFSTKKSGNGSINFDEIKVLLNDGKGTPTKIGIFNFQFSISKQASTSQTPISEIEDIEIPEDFRPIIASDPSIFNGKYFLVFATQDKSSSIDHYEVREGKWGWFIIAESPYLLKYQSLNKKIFVKAIDKAGNERLVMLEPRNHTPWYQQYLLFGIILIIIAFGFLLKKIWPRFIK